MLYSTALAPIISWRSGVGDQGLDGTLDQEFEALKSGIKLNWQSSDSDENDVIQVIVLFQCMPKFVMKTRLP